MQTEIHQNKGIFVFIESGVQSMNEKILWSLSYGLYAIGVEGEHYPSACIVNSVVQVTAQPAILAVSINHNSYTHQQIMKHKRFTVSVLSEDTSGAVIGALGFTTGRNTEKLKNIRYKMLQEGLPVLKENICCWMLCKVIRTAETPTHTVFFAEIEAGSERSVGRPMTYEYYHKVIKGMAPQSAPTYQPPDRIEEKSVEEWICTICGYVYNDPDVPFEDLPAEWTCPVCRAGKSMFQRK